MIEVASFIATDEAFVARGVVQLRKLDGMRFNSIL